MEKSRFEETLFVPILKAMESIDSEDFSLRSGFLFPRFADLPRGLDIDGLVDEGGVGIIGLRPGVAVLLTGTSGPALRNLRRTGAAAILYMGYNLEPVRYLLS